MTRPLLLGLTSLALLPGALFGQATFDMNVLNGGKPEPGVPIEMILNAGKVPMGETDADGTVELPTGDEIPVGTEVAVYAIECDGQRRIVLVPPGESIDAECERSRIEDPNCECRRIGVIIWGQGPAVIDLRPPGTSPISERVEIGLRLDYHGFPNWDGVACGDDAGCDADAGGRSIGGFVGLRFGDRFSLGLGAGYGWAPDVRRTVGSGDAEISTNFFYVDPYAQFRPVDDLDFRVSAGASWMRNDASFIVPRASGGTEEYDRTEDSLNPFVRADFGIPISPRVDLLFGGGYASKLDDADADSGRYSLSAGVRYSFGGDS